MMPRLVLTFRIVLLACLVLAAVPGAGAQPTPRTATPQTADQSSSRRPIDGPEDLDGRYIVVLRDDVVSAAEATTDLARRRGLSISHVYSQAFSGFAADVPAAEVEALRRDPRVASVQPDRWLLPYEQSVPRGAKRIGADKNSVARIDGVDQRVSVDIAILDSGVGPHADLNIAGGVDCTGAGSYNDNVGHGTHVAGIAAAVDNGIGIVGVAPGARIWSVKVLEASGGAWSWVICGIDWVTARAGTIDVANMSLGEVYGSDTTCAATTLHQAICNSVNAGVTYVVAAGNGSADAGEEVPAQYDEVIAVSAIADSDGKPGGLGSPTSAGPDDHLADFSNYGSAVDIAAPGVSTNSTARGGGYGYRSGTSFAAPHVTGAAALYIAEHGRVGPAAVRAGLLSDRETGSIPSDPDGISEGVVNVDDGGFARIVLSPTTGKVDDVISVSLSGYSPSESVDIQWDGTTKMSATTDGAGKATTTIKIPAGAKGSHTIRGVSATKSASAPFVVFPRVRLIPSSGEVGWSVDVSLRGFAKREKLTIRWYNGSSTVTLATVTTSNTGSANVAIVVPAAPKGGHKIEATGTSGSKVSATFTVVPRIRLTPSSGAAGSNVSVSLRGYAAAESVQVRWNDGSSSTVLATTTTSSTGSKTITVAVPASASVGAYVIEGAGSKGSVASQTFNVTAEIAPAAETATAEPTGTPTATPTQQPIETAAPTETATPTATAPTLPTETPTATPTVEPTAAPTDTPTETPAPDP